MNKSNCFLFLTLICSFGCATLAEGDVAFTYPVPAIIWQKSGADSSNLVPVPALSIKRKSEFGAQVAEFGQVVMFIRDLFCPEDLKCRQGDVTCHQYLSQIKQRTYYPAVEDPVSAVRELNQTSLNVYVDTTDALSEKISDQRITYVDLGPQRSGETKESYNIRLDHAIEGVVSKLDGNFVFILTGESCNPHPATVSRQRRDTPPAEPVTVLKNNNLFVYFTELIVYMKSGTKTTLYTNSTTLTVSDVTASSLKAQLKGESVTIDFSVYNIGSIWYVREITVNGVSNSTPSKSISAPIRFSYKCTPVWNITLNDKEVDAVGIRGIQLQPKFTNESGEDKPLTRFGDANDCTGFTSIGIWSGLIVSFLLLGILTMGLSWILDIRTMDRFDDPKGKTITVTATD